MSRKHHSRRIVHLRKVLLENGLTILYDHFPGMKSVACTVSLVGGTRDETERTTGITHLLEHMVFRRTKTKSTNQIARTIDDLGGDLNAFTTTNLMSLVGTVPRTRIFELLDFFAELLLHCSFRNEDLKIEKEIVRQEILEANDDPFDRVVQLFNENFWPHSGLGLPVFGKIPVVERCRCSTLEHRLDALLAGRRIIVAMVGDLSLRDVVAHLNDKFGHLRKGKAYVPTAPRTGHGIHSLSRPVHQSYVIIGRAFPALLDKHYLHGVVISTILGEAMSSRLFQLVREKHGLAYSIASDVDAYADTACLSITAVLEKHNVEKALRDIVEELRKISAGHITREEFQRVIRLLSSQIEMSVDHIMTRLWRAVETEIHFGRYISTDEICQRLAQLSDDDIRHASQQCLPLEKFLLTIGGNVKGVKFKGDIARICEG